MKITFFKVRWNEKCPFVVWGIALNVNNECDDERRLWRIVRKRLFSNGSISNVERHLRRNGGGGGAGGMGKGLGAFGPAAQCKQGRDVGEFDRTECVPKFSAGAQIR